MNILVIGGTGFISRRLVQRLLDRSDRVTLITRGCTASQHHERLEHLVADRTLPLDLKRSIGDRRFDVVYDMIAYRPEESAAAARLLRGRVGRFIHCSTVSVYMVSNETSCPITEDQDRNPLMPFWDRNPFGMEYGIMKRQCEEVLWRVHDERLFPVSVLRPTFVSGPEDPAGRDYFWIQRILDGSPLLVPGSGEFPFQQVYVEDVARMFAALLEHPNSIGQAYNIAAEETFTLNEYLFALGHLMGKPFELIHMEQEEFDRLPLSSSPGGDVFPFNTRRPATFCLDRIKRDLHYRSTPFAQWMNMTIESCTRRNQAPSLGYEYRSEEIEICHRLRQDSQDGIKKAAN